MKRILKAVARALPGTQQRGISEIYHGLRTFAGRNRPVPSARAVPAAPAAPPIVQWRLPSSFGGPVSIPQFEDIVRTYDAADAQMREKIIGDVFDAVSLRPAAMLVLRTPYAQTVFGDAPIFQVALAAAESGSGQHQQAAQRLQETYRKTPCAALAITAARPLMRPAGNEQAARQFLDIAATAHPDDFRIGLHQATAHFLTGDKLSANAIVARHKSAWVQALGPKLAQDATDLAQELKTAIAARDPNRITKYDSDVYLEKNIRAHWEPYQYDMLTSSGDLMFGWLANFFAKQISTATQKYRADEVYNFGVMCAEGDSVAARENPNVQFIGVDRQQTTATINEKAYPIPNMSFAAGEIEDIITGLPAGKRRILFHARTATLCYPEKLKNLYKLCFDKGFEAVVLYENYTISHHYYRFFDFDDMPDVTITCKNYQFLHNYKRLLKDAGFVLADQQNMFSPLISPFWITDLGLTHTLIVAERGGEA